MSRDEIRRLEIAEMFAGLSIFDRGPGRGKPTSIGYSRVGSWLAPKPRERKAGQAKRHTRPKMSRDERLRRRAARELARYHSLSPAEKKARNRQRYASIKADSVRLEKRRTYNRQQARDARDAGTSGYQRMTPGERKAHNARVYAQKKRDAAKLEKMRREKREWMRKKRAGAQKP